MVQPTEAPFYMVFLEEGNTPAVKHKELTVAQVEAARLARTHNRKAYILCAVEVMTPEIRAVRSQLVQRQRPTFNPRPMVRLTKEDF